MGGAASRTVLGACQRTAVAGRGRVRRVARWEEGSGDAPVSGQGFGAAHRCWRWPRLVRRLGKTGARRRHGTADAAVDGADPGEWRALPAAGGRWFPRVDRWIATPARRVGVRWHRAGR